MIQQKVTHVGFSDESHWNVGRFRSLGLVTLPACHLKDFEKELGALLLNQSGVSEFKWKKLAGAKERFAAQRICNFAIEKAVAGQLRVDVLIWDIQDSRHRVQGRDDTANLGRMYYHLLRNVLRKRWPNYAVWKLHVDEHTALNWGTIQDCLQAKSVSLQIDNSLFVSNAVRINLYQEFGIAEIKDVTSANHPLLQVADLFAGLAVFSWDKYERYNEWCTDRSPQASLFGDGQRSLRQSHSERERFQVLKHFDDECKKQRLGVSLKTKKGLWTPDPMKPINFWVYEPQHLEDKAPTRGSA